VSSLPRPSARQVLHGFVLLAAKTAQTKLTYRLATLVSLLASVTSYGVYLLVWLAIYRENTRPLPLSRDEMCAYLIVAFLVNSLLVMSVELRFGQRIRSGLVASDLLRPIGFLALQMGQAAGDVLVNMVYALPLFAVGYWFVGSALLPHDGLALALALPSIGLGFLIAFGLSYLIVQASFVLQSGYGVFFLRAALHQVFSGLSAPLVMFPRPLRAVAEALPFHHEIETPARIWLGLVAWPEALRLMAWQAAWGLGLLAAGELILNAVMRRHQVQGG
jgi:ABC-2 type transport system permease protein